MITQADVILTLSGDAALVLDAAFATSDDFDARLGGPAERAAVWELEAALERQLVATFSPEYDTILQAARLRLIESSYDDPVPPANPPSTALPPVGTTSTALIGQCCFCGRDASPNDVPVADLHIDRPDTGTQSLRAHQRCLRRLLHPSVPLLTA